MLELRYVKWKEGIMMQKSPDEVIQILEGAQVVERTGAVGKIRSVYVRDPDGNLIE